ncbi:ubiquitin receptor RAD23d-like isoform X2 [Amaranthus tricolor]|uniref:ubiquitin receptor RAD23d-like isoform X2 n=1 Tax=Amaranthus tricolor TaxID=29722 RepID=UPI0025837A00|nr:ubiquitin receptor RAD23d-like isoform X2 [Amaranthus tricolor]
MSMKIFIKSLKGKHFQIEVNPDDTVGAVKKTIESVQGEKAYPASQQMLIYQGKTLIDGTTLRENKVAENSFLVVMLFKSKSSSGRSSVVAEVTPTTKDPAPPMTLVEASNKLPPTVTDATLPALSPTSASTPEFPSVEESSSTPPVTVTIASRATDTSKSLSIDSIPKHPPVTCNAPPMILTDASRPASMPTSVSAPLISSSTSISDAKGQTTSGTQSANDLENTIQHIIDIGGGTWDRDTVTRALRAAFNNPERAIGYLYSGIPEKAEAPSVAQFAGDGLHTNTPSVSQQPTLPTSVPSRRSNAGSSNIFPLGFFSRGSSAAPTGVLDFLRNSEQFQALRAMVQANPQVLQPMLEDFGKQNPNLMKLIQEHQTEFHRLLHEPVKGEERKLLEELTAAMPHAIQVTTDEHAAIERLEAMGFDRSRVLEAYFACNKNEELTANYLVDHMHDFED